MPIKLLCHDCAPEGTAGPMRYDFCAGCGVRRACFMTQS